MPLWKLRRLDLLFKLSLLLKLSALCLLFFDAG